MLDLFGWDVGMGAAALLLVVLGGLMIGIFFQSIGEVRVGWDWAATSVAAIFGAYIGSEGFNAASTWGPVFDGLYLLPAVIGAVIFGSVVDAILRYLTEGSYSRHPRPI